MKIRLPLSYVTIIEGNYAEIELFTASEARKEIGVSKSIWDRWCRQDLIAGHVVDRTERLYDWHQLDIAAVAGPVREFLRNRNEPIEEVIKRA